MVPTLRLTGRLTGMALPLAAAIGCLQPGFDPVFLAVLTRASGLPGSTHGLIVAATQGGAALGALAVWYRGAQTRPAAFAAIAALAVAASLATPLLHGLGAVLLVRGAYGVAMGAVYAHAMAACARARPVQAYAGVYLLQLVLATVVSELLPHVAAALGPGVALAGLALAPAVAALALALADRPASGPDHAPAVRAVVPMSGWALAAATFLVIAATMQVWSFSAALALKAGLGERTIGHAVAVGSVAGAFTALAVMRERLALPRVATAIVCGLALAAPLVTTRPGGDVLFALGIVLLNLGSTVLIVRFSGEASATSRDARFRTFVASTHALGTIAGPLLGSLAMALAGPAGLSASVAACLAAMTGAAMLGGRAGLVPPAGRAQKGRRDRANRA